MHPTDNRAPGDETPETTVVDAPNVTEQDTTDNADRARDRADAYMEACLLRGLMGARYRDVLTLCDGEPEEAIYSPSRRLILHVLLSVARDAVAEGAGARQVSQSAVIARLERAAGPEAAEAMTVDMPEILAGATAYGSLASPPGIHEIPLLWQSVRRARVIRGMYIAGSVLTAASASRDTAEVRRALDVARQLIQHADRAGMTRTGKSSQWGGRNS